MWQSPIRPSWSSSGTSSRATRSLDCPGQVPQRVAATARIRIPGNTFWVMAGSASSKKNVDWLNAGGITVPPEFVYQAPIYGSKIEDRELIDKLQLLRPKHVVITVGGGTQERLGLYLKRNLDYLPAIHCIGAAIAFLSGDQVRIPDWADRLYLGWLFRCLSSPRRFVPRYLSASQLIPLLWHYRDQLPVPEASEQPLPQADKCEPRVLRADDTGEID